MAFKNVIYDYYSKDLSSKVKSIKKIQQKRGDFCGSKTAIRIYYFPWRRWPAL